MESPNRFLEPSQLRWYPEYNNRGTESLLKKTRLEGRTKVAPLNAAPLCRELAGDAAILTGRERFRPIKLRSDKCSPRPNRCALDDASSHLGERNRNLRMCKESPC